MIENWVNTFVPSMGKRLMKLASIIFSHNTLCSISQETLLFKFSCPSERSVQVAYEVLSWYIYLFSIIFTKQFMKNELP